MLNFLRKKSLTFYTCKDYLFTRAREMSLNPNITTDTASHYEIEFTKGTRKVTVTMFVYKHSPVTIDVKDSHFILRIPRTTANSDDKFKLAANEILCKIDQYFYSIK